LKNLDFKK